MLRRIITLLMTSNFWSKLAKFFNCNCHDWNKLSKILLSGKFQLSALVHLCTMTDLLSTTWSTTWILKGLKASSKFGEIDYNLHNHVFDDFICKPPCVLYRASMYNLQNRGCFFTLLIPFLSF